MSNNIAIVQYLLASIGIDDEDKMDSIIKDRNAKTPIRLGILSDQAIESLVTEQEGTQADADALKAFKK